MSDRREILRVLKPFRFLDSEGRLYVQDIAPIELDPLPVVATAETLRHPLPVPVTAEILSHVPDAVEHVRYTTRAIFERRTRNR